MSRSNCRVGRVYARGVSYMGSGKPMGYDPGRGLSIQELDRFCDALNGNRDLLDRVEVLTPFERAVNNKDLL